MWFPLRRRSRLAALVIVLFALTAAGIAYASIPDSQGVIHGCFKPSTRPSGALRVIDTAKGQRCEGGELPLDWNQTGPKGATGPTGPSAISGLFETLTTTDFQIAGGQTISVSASCTAPRVPLTGSVVPGSESNLLTKLSYPGGGSWHAVVQNEHPTDSNTFKLTFTCVDPAAVK